MYKLLYTLEMFDDIPAEGIVIAECGKPVAKVIRILGSCSELIGSIDNFAANDEDGLFSTGISWDAESGRPHTR